MPETIVLIVDDLMFLPRLKNGLQNLGYRVLEATDESRLTTALFQSPVLVIIDLFSQGFNWPALIKIVKKSKAGPVPIVAFGPHVDLQLRDQALKAGCNVVVGRGAVSSNLGHLVEKHKWKLNRSRCAETAPDHLIEGISLFNAGEYYECHEAIEEAWVAEKEPVRIMYQGILQIAVACYHIENKNWRGSMKLLDRGLPKLERFAPDCMTIDLEQLIRDAEGLRTELLRLGVDWHWHSNGRF
jgi:CheY-like chemotaxis protein